MPLRAFLSGGRAGWPFFQRRKNFRSSPFFLLTGGAVSPIYNLTPRGSNSVVECNLAKVEVAGSNPVSRSTKSKKPYASKAFFVRGHNSTVECQLPKLKVTGSNPAARSSTPEGLGLYLSPFLLSSVCHFPPYPSYTSVTFAFLLCSWHSGTDSFPRVSVPQHLLLPG